MFLEHMHKIRIILISTYYIGMIAYNESGCCKQLHL